MQGKTEPLPYSGESLPPHLPHDGSAMPGMNWAIPLQWRVTATPTTPRWLRHARYELSHSPDSGESLPPHLPHDGSAKPGINWATNPLRWGVTATLHLPHDGSAMPGMNWATSPLQWGSHIRHIYSTMAQPCQENHRATIPDSLEWVTCTTSTPRWFSHAK